jgi:hypothetical protein
VRPGWTAGARGETRTSSSCTPLLAEGGPVRRQWNPSQSRPGGGPPAGTQPGQVTPLNREAVTYRCALLTDRMTKAPDRALRWSGACVGAAGFEPAASSVSVGILLPLCAPGDSQAARHRGGCREAVTSGHWRRRTGIGARVRRGLTSGVERAASLTLPTRFSRRCPGQSRSGRRCGRDGISSTRSW